ncbi:MAG TPA: 6-phosphogluconolactonase [bacterium]|nr:6-phosphogluconolactonase [bacterium]
MSDVAGRARPRRAMDFRILPDAQAVAEAAAELWVDEANRALKSEGRFTIALSGGSTPRFLYEALLSGDGAHLDWKRTHLFWGDERCVPPDHPESNYGMVHQALLTKIDIPSENVYRMRGENPDPRAAAHDYDLLLRAFFGGYGPRQTFDLILLGMGQDGHTASLFPDSPALDDATHWATASRAPAGVSPRDRITLTLPPILAAARCVFLVTGEKKRGVLSAIRKDPAAAAERYPAARVALFRESTWLIDEQAAGTERS